MLKMVDGTGIIGIDMVCPLGGAVSPPQPPNYDNVEVEGVGSLTLPNSLKAPLERLELLGNSVQGENPAPEAPQEITSAGRKSKNLFDIADLKNGLVQSDGTIKVYGFYKSIVLNIKEDGKYFITFKKNDEYDDLYFTTLYSLETLSKPYTHIYPDVRGAISLKKGRNILSFKVRKNGSDCEFTNDHEIMITAESETTDYEPYGYLLDLKVTGKNLLNLQKSPDVKGIYQGYKVGDGKSNIVMSIRDKGNNADITGCYLGITKNGINANGGLVWIVSNGNIATDKVVHTYQFVTIYPANESSVQKLLERFDIQVEYGDTATPYEPYTEQTLTLASDHPLTKWDKLVEQGGEYGWLYSGEKIILTGEERWSVFDKQFYTTAYDIQRFDSAFCECYDYSDALNSLSKDCTFTIGAGVYPNSIFLKDNKYLRFLESGGTDNVKSLEVFTQYLKDMFSKGTPIEILLKSKNSNFVPLSESEQVQLRNLHSYNGTTHINIDSGEVECGIKLTYRKEI